MLKNISQIRFGCSIWRRTPSNLLTSGFLLVVFCAGAIFATAITGSAQTFENPPYTTGNVNGQDGWVFTGTYDIAVSSSLGTSGFGSQSLRMSNASTSGSFGDWAFSKPIAGEAGETSAANDGQSVGPRSKYYEANYSIASAVPGSQQPGLQFQIDPDRGDGARMSYLRYEDLADGIHVFFDDYRDRAPYGTTIAPNDPLGCGAGDDFTETDIATLDRTVPHTVRITMEFIDGPGNDIVRVYIDGVFRIAGTSWEDYFRYCEGNPTRTVDSQIFLARAGSGTAPGTFGAGFLVDNITQSTMQNILVVDDDLACPGAAYTTITAAIGAAATGDVIQVCSGNYSEDVLVNKTLTIKGAGPFNTVVSGPIGGAGATFTIAASGVDLSGFDITRAGNNPADWNLATLNSAGIAIQGQALTGTVIHDNTIEGNRTAIDINNSNGHTVRNNVITNNHTGMIFRNQTDNMVVTENDISNNRTVGILFLDASSGSNIPVQTALNGTFNNNSISGNWYGQIVDRQTGGSLPAPGTTNLKNFRFNWLGSTTPVVTVANSAEPGYSLLIPVGFGGSATAPGGQPDVAGPASANLIYLPVLSSGTDTNVETTPGRGTFGFQGGPSTLVVRPGQMNGWIINQAGAATADFQAGPPTPPLGIGSGHFSIGSDGDDYSMFRTQAFAGSPLSDFTAFSYSTYSQSGGTNQQAPVFSIRVDTDGDTVADDVLYFEPVYQTGSYGGDTFPNQCGVNPNCVTYGQWQTWNPFLGGFWLDSDNSGGPPMHTLANYIATNPTAKVASDGPGSVRVFAGGGAGAWDNYIGNLDNITIGVNSNNVTYDFEPVRPTVTINQASGQADPTSTLPVNFTVVFSEPVTGFGPSDVLLSGSALPTTAVVTGSGTTYNVAVGGVSGSGTITADILDNAAVNGSNVPSEPSTSTDNVITYFTCNNVSAQAVSNTFSNTQVVVPINVDDTTGRSILSYDFTLTYDPAVVSPVAVETTGTLSSGWTISTNNSPGSLVVSGFSTTPLSGQGVLANIRFVAFGGIGTSSPVNLSAFEFNEGVPCVVTTNGVINIISGTISGKVTYVNGPGTPAVQYTTIAAAGLVPVSSVTDVNGDYSLSGLGAGAYTVTPSKTNQVHEISNLDASTVAQHVVGFITLSATKQIAADVTGNGTITSLDAAYIAQFVANLPNPGVTGTWKFIPASRSYASVLVNSANQDYSAILMGEVTGNWNNAGPLAPSFAGDDSELLGRPERRRSVVVRAVIDPAVAPGSDFTVDLKAFNKTGEDIFGYQFELAYDPSVMRPTGIEPCEIAGTISSSQSAVCNSGTPGMLRVVVFGAGAIERSGTLLKLNFKAIGRTGSSSDLTFTNFMFNEGLSGSVDGIGKVVIGGKGRGRN